MCATQHCFVLKSPILHSNSSCNYLIAPISAIHPISSLCYICFPSGPGYPYPPAPIYPPTSGPTCSVLGYMPLRGDFDVEFDNDAELMLADIEFRGIRLEGCGDVVCLEVLVIQRATQLCLGINDFVLQVYVNWASCSCSCKWCLCETFLPLPSTRRRRVPGWKRTEAQSHCMFEDFDFFLLL